MSTQTEQALLDSIPTGLFIGGEWIDGETGGTFDVIDPATGAVIRTIADATPATASVRWMRPSLRRIRGRRPHRAPAARSCAVRSTSCRSTRRTSRC